MSKSGKTPDGTSFVVRRPMLPAGLGSVFADSALAPGRSGGLGGLIFRVVFFLTLGLLLLPISLFFRLVFGRWTVDARIGFEQSRRWRAKSRRAAGEGVEAVAGALERGEPIDALPGLTPS